MTFRERFLHTVQFKAVDRLPERHAYGLMPGVLESWYRQGLPATVTTDDDFLEYFGFPPASAPLPIDLGPIPSFDERIVEDTEKHRISIDRWGRKTRLMKGVTTIALGKEFPVSDMESWLPYKERLTDSAGRVSEALEDAARRNLATGGINRFSSMGFYWFPRDLMGDEALAVAFYEDPELVHSINDTWCTLMEHVLQQVLSRIDIDVIHLNEDMAYKNASMIGRKHFDEFMLPYYTRLGRIVERYDTPVFSVDSDGFIGELCEWFSACGVNLIGPNEVRAGNDIAAYRNRFDRTLAFDGGIDKLVLPEGRSAIDSMLERTVPPMMDSGGGWIVSLDHRVVPGTRLADFRYYLDRVRKLTTF